MDRKYEFDSLCVVGLGYIGLPTATCFASKKISVLGVDVSEDVVSSINKAHLHIEEPNLEEVFRVVIKEGYLRASRRPEPADAFIICVPTPLLIRDNGERYADLSFVDAAVNSISPVLVRGNLVILESTVPVGSTERISKSFASQRPDLSFPHVAGDSADVLIAHCPERVLPGRIMHELMANDRIIGGLTTSSSKAAAALFQTFVEGDCIITDARTAEMCKLAENAYRDLNIAFSNELAMVCQPLGIDPFKLISLANRHPRVDILQPGPGVGGHCIAIDPWFLVESTGGQAPLVRQARETNDRKRQWVVDRIKDEINMRRGMEGMNDVRVACLGLTFKPDVADIRESPALAVTADIARLGCQVLAIDPNLSSLPAVLAEIGTVTLERDINAAVQGADVVVVLVAHKPFRERAADILAAVTTRNIGFVDIVGL